MTMCSSFMWTQLSVSQTETPETDIRVTEPTGITKIASHYIQSFKRLLIILCIKINDLTLAFFQIAHLY